MSDQHPTEPEKLFGISEAKSAETSREHLLGSTAADIVAGIVATIVWWGIGVAVASSYPRHTGPAGGIMFCLFSSQVLAVGLCARGAGVFILTQILTAILLPLLAVGLAFGACLVMAR
jgi:hypothetical protein